MKTLRALLYAAVVAACLLPIAAFGQITEEPICYPFENPDRSHPPYLPHTGFHFTNYYSGSGPWIVWYCWNAEAQRWHGYGRVMPFGPALAKVKEFGYASLELAISSEAESIRAKKVTAASVDKKWRDTSWSCPTSYTPLCNEATAFMKANFPAPRTALPPEGAKVWVVKANGTYKDRPAYPWNGTTRGTASNGRALVGSPCNASIGRLEVGGAYYGVNSRTDQVAVCEIKQ